MGMTNYYSSLIFSYSTLEWSSLVSLHLFQPPCFLFFKMVLNLNVSIHLNILVAIISSYLSWSSHILSVRSKARQTIGIIYHNFYKHASSQTLFTLYHSLVIPYFTYCSSVWDPSFFSPHQFWNSFENSTLSSKNVVS